MSKNSIIGLVAAYFLSAVLVLTLVSLDFCETEQLSINLRKFHRFLNFLIFFDVMYLPQYYWLSCRLFFECCFNADACITRFLCFR